MSLHNFLYDLGGLAYQFNNLEAEVELDQQFIVLQFAGKF